MTPEEEITALAQSIYLVKNNRYNDVEDEELTDFLEQTIDWVNQFTQELELEADWNYLRTNRNLIATIVDTSIQTYPLPTEVRTVVVSPYRDVVIEQGGTVVSHFTMVNPNQISDPTDPYTGDRATVINRQLILSRPLTENELGGELRADTIDTMPQLAIDDVNLLTLVRPQQLIVLGVAKNATLPDIVQGGISPSVTQKYNDLLQKAVAANNATAEALEVPTENFNFIRGVW
jgi:hypothetical protein